MSNASLTSTSTPSGPCGASTRLPVLTLIVASVAAVLSVIAIATDDVGTPANNVSVEQPAVQQQSGAGVVPTPSVRIHRNVDGCGRPIFNGVVSCW